MGTAEYQFQNGLLADEFAEGFPRRSASVVVSEMRPFGVVVDEPGVEVVL